MVPQNGCAGDNVLNRRTLARKTGWLLSKQHMAKGRVSGYEESSLNHQNHLGQLPWATASSPGQPAPDPILLTVLKSPCFSTVLLLSAPPPGGLGSLISNKPVFIPVELYSLKGSRRSRLHLAEGEKKLTANPP